MFKRHVTENDFNQIYFLKFPWQARLVIFLIITYTILSFINFFAFISCSIILVTIVFKFLFLIKIPSRYNKKIYNVAKNLQSAIDIKEKTKILDIHESELKTYSILLPIYQENERTLANLSQIINNISYPKHLLSIFVICEEGDKSSIEIAKKFFCHIEEILIVPDGKLKTKPRALNYAMNFVKSEYLTVYDAEDLPDENQLLLANFIFKNSDKNLAAIQSELAFYNNVNYISEIMSIEYQHIFSHRNYFMAKLFNFFPIGGTGNHFKTDLIKSCLCWNSYNVTEDAEIAMRISMKEMKISTMPIKTFEESVISINQYIGQRSRWIKGFMQTFFYQIFVILFKKSTFHAKKRQLLLAIYFGATILPPFAFITINITYYIKVIFSKEKIISSAVIYFVILNIFLKLIYDFCLKFNSFPNKRGKKNLKHKSVLIYELLSTYIFTAAYIKALIEMTFNPYYWSKTYHSGGFAKKFLSNKNIKNKR